MRCRSSGVVAEHGDQDGRDGDGPDRSFGAVLEAALLVAGPLPVHAAAVRGAARVRVSIPQPRAGRWQSARRRAMASSGRSAP